jgi:hypothetical protein
MGLKAAKALMPAAGQGGLLPITLATAFSSSSSHSNGMGSASAGRGGGGGGGNSGFLNHGNFFYVRHDHEEGMFLPPSLPSPYSPDSRSSNNTNNNSSSSGSSATVTNVMDFMTSPRTAGGDDRTYDVVSGEVDNNIHNNNNNSSSSGLNSGGITEALVLLGGNGLRTLWGGVKKKTAHVLEAGLASLESNSTLAVSGHT